MVSKKYTVLVALLLTLQVASFAQTSGWDWKDSSVVPVKSLTQYNEFMQNKNPFPAKPRNAAEFGVGVGYSNVTGDSRSGSGLGLTLSYRKALSNFFSYRLGYAGSYNTGKGATYDYSRVPTTISPLQQGYTTPDYRNTSHNFSLELVASVNTFSNYRGDPISNLYLFTGLGIAMSETKIKDVNGNFTTIAPPHKYYMGRIGKTQYLFTTFDVGGGYAYKINKKFNIGIEERIISPVKKVNYVTGYNAQTGTKNIYYLTQVKFNFNLF